MGLWRGSSSDFSKYEDKSFREYHYEKVKNRMESNTSIKQTIVIILIGIFFAITLTVLEYALKNPEVTGLLRTVIRVGFLISLIGVLNIPYGIYNFIKSFKNNKS